MSAENPPDDRLVKSEKKVKKLKGRVMDLETSILSWEQRLMEIDQQHQNMFSQYSKKICRLSSELESVRSKLKSSNKRIKELESKLEVSICPDPYKDSIKTSTPESRSRNTADSDGKDFVAENSGNNSGSHNNNNTVNIAIAHDSAESNNINIPTRNIADADTETTFPCSEEETTQNLPGEEEEGEDFSESQENNNVTDDENEMYLQNLTIEPLPSSENIPTSPPRTSRRIQERVQRLLSQQSTNSDNPPTTITNSNFQELTNPELPQRQESFVSNEQAESGIDNLVVAINPSKLIFESEREGSEGNFNDDDEVENIDDEYVDEEMLEEEIDDEEGEEEDEQEIATDFFQAGGSINNNFEDQGPEMKPYHCTKCFSCFRYQHQLTSHLKNCTKSTFDCHLCPQKFGIDNALDAHLEKVHQIECRIPDLSEYETENLKLVHTGIHTRTSGINSRRNLENSRNYSRYSKQNSGNSDRNPQNSTRNFENPGRASISIPRRDPTMPALTAQRSYYNKNKLQLECQICGVILGSKWALKKHQENIHDRGKERAYFECDHCGRKCLTKKTLEIHVTYAHNGEKPYQCSNCHIKVTRRDTLRKHLMRCCGLAGEKVQSSGVDRVQNSGKSSAAKKKIAAKILAKKKIKRKFVPTGAVLGKFPKVTLTRIPIIQNSLLEDPPLSPALFSCPKCGKNFTSARRMHGHLSFHRRYPFKRKTGRKNRNNNKEVAPPPEEFNYKSEIFDEAAEISKNLQNPGKQTLCIICNHNYSSDHNLKRHLRQRHPEVLAGEALEFEF